jgi:hypothetical protein
MEPLKRRFPEDYNSVVQAYLESYQSGKTEAEYKIAGQGALLAILKRLRPLADDDVLADFGAILADQYDALGLKSSVQCYRYASGVGNTIIAPDFPEALVARANNVDKRVIETATLRAAVSTASISAVWKRIGVALTTRGVKNDQFGLLAADTVPPEKYAEYCTVAAIVFREISKLPRNEAGILLRDILTEK